MIDELKATIEDAIFTCSHRSKDYFGDGYVCLNSKGARPCDEIVNSGKCKMLTRLFGEEQEHE